MKKTLINTLSFIIIGAKAFAQNVNIPDANFKAYLLGESTINTNSDNEIQVSEATAFTGIMSPNYLGISDLTGIEAFVNMTGLFAEGNNLTSIDVSSCVNLERLTLQENNLSNLDLSNNINLWLLYIWDNNISTLDLSANTALEYLDCSNTSISILDLSNNSNLLGLVCSHNNISAIDMSFCPMLMNLVALSSNLTALNLKNVSTSSFINVTSNPNLTCIEVDNVADATANWTNIDPIASFSLNCNTSDVSETELNQLFSIYPNPTTSILNIVGLSNTENFVILNLQGSIVQSGSTFDFINVDQLQNGTYFLQFDNRPAILLVKE